MTRKIALLTDSTSDLPPALAQERDIFIIPQRVVWDNQTYLDGVELTSADFYQRLAQSTTLPETLPPSAADFAEAFREARDQSGAEHLLAILLSAKLSRSGSNAQAGARLVDFPVFVLDSQTVSMSLGFSVLAAADARDNGGSIDDMLEAARQIRRQTSLYFTLNTLEFLQRGGRIGAMQHILGRTLSVKPIMCIEDGEIRLAENARGRVRAVQRMIELTAAADERPPVRIAVTHGNAPDEAYELMDRLSTQFQTEAILACSISPALGAHAGPGALGIVVSRC